MNARRWRGAYSSDQRSKSEARRWFISTPRGIGGPAQARASPPSVTESSGVRARRVDATRPPSESGLSCTSTGLQRGSTPPALTEDGTSPPQWGHRSKTPRVRSAFFTVGHSSEQPAHAEVAADRGARVAVPLQEVVDAAPAGAVHEAAVDEDDGGPGVALQVCAHGFSSRDGGYGRKAYADPPRCARGSVHRSVVAAHPAKGPVCVDVPLKRRRTSENPLRAECAEGAPAHSGG